MPSAPGKRAWLAWRVAALGLVAACIGITLAGVEVGADPRLDRLPPLLYHALISGSLALISLTVWFCVRAAGHWPDDSAPQFTLAVWAILAGGAALIFGLSPSGRLHQDLGVFTMFVVPPSVLLSGAFLHHAATLLPTPRAQAVLLGGFSVMSFLIIHVAFRSAKGNLADDSVRMASGASACIGMAVLAWMVVWGRPQKPPGPNPLQPDQPLGAVRHV